MRHFLFIPAYNTSSRKQNHAFSGYARGWFLTIPYGHCSLPPRLRRFIHENLASLRFSVSLWFYIFNNLLARAKTTLFALALHLAIPCLTEGVKRRHSNNMRAPKDAAERGKPLGFPLKLSTFSFVSSKEKVRTTIASPSSPAGYARRRLWRGRQNFWHGTARALPRRSSRRCRCSISFRAGRV